MFDLNGSVLIWMGDAASYHAAVKLEARAMEMNTPAIKAQYDSNEAEANKGGVERLPRLYSRNGSVGIISIKGAIVNSENWITEFLNIATYPAIQAAAAFAAQDPTVDRVLMDVGSPGGHVAGLQATGEILKQLKKVKPLYTYSDSSMGSAAYWLGSIGSKIWVNDTTTVGSIGTVVIHSEQSKALKDEGVAVNVIRSGPFKMLGNSVEPLSEKAREVIQDLVDKNAAIFKAEVADNRGMTAKAVEEVGQGKEYLGADALQAGLVDGLLSISEVFGKMEGKKKVDKLQNINNNPFKPMKGYGMSGTRTILTQEAMAAAIAEGADPATLEAEALTAEQEAAAAEAAKLEAAAISAATAEEAAREAATDSKVVLDAKDGKIELLASQLVTAQNELMDLKVKHKTLEAKLASDLSSLDALKKIAGDSVGKMLVALKGPAMSLEGFTAEQVVARHGEVSEKFAKEFKVGGVAISNVDSEDDKLKAPSNVSSLQKARINAAKIGSKK